MQALDQGRYLSSKQSRTLAADKLWQLGQVRTERQTPNPAASPFLPENPTEAPGSFHPPPAQPHREVTRSTAGHEVSSLRRTRENNRSRTPGRVSGGARLQAPARRGTDAPAQPSPEAGGSGASAADPGEGAAPPHAPSVPAAACFPPGRGGGGGGGDTRRGTQRPVPPRRPSLVVPTQRHRAPAGHHGVRGGFLGSAEGGIRTPPLPSEGNLRFPNFPRALTGGAHGAPRAPRRPLPRPSRHGPSEG